LIRELTDGFLGIPRAFELLGSRRIGKYVLFSGLFGLLVGVGLSLLLYIYFDDAGNWISSAYPFEWGRDFVGTISKWLVLLIGILLLAFSFKYIILIVLSPILSYISEVIEEELTGKSSKPFSISRFGYEMSRSVRINTRNIFKELFYTAILFLISMFPLPGIRLITTTAILLIQAYYMGFGNLDFLLERHLNFRQSVAFVRNYRWMAIGNGLGFLLLFAIPVIGFILAPTLSAIGATVEGLERLENEDEP